MFKKILAVLLCLALFISILPSYVFAEEDSTPQSDTENQVLAQDLEEVEHERDAYSKTYVNEEGTFTKEIYAEPIHTKIDGEWTEISTDVKLDKAEGQLETEATQLEAAYPSKISSNEEITYTFEDHVLEFTNISASDGSKEFSLKSDATTQYNDNKVLYEDVLPGIDLRHVSLNNEVKEDWIINDYQGIHQFNYEVSTDLIAHLNEDGSIGFYEDASLKKKVFELPSPVMEDSNINDALGTGVKSTDLHYELSSLGDSTYSIQLVADTNWLEAKERVFPVYVDPSVTIEALGDSYVSSADPASNFNKQWNSVYGEYVLRVGKYDASTGTNYAYVKFEIIGDLKGAIIDSANLNVFVTHTYSATEKTGLWVDRVNAPWYVDSLTWNNKPSSTNITSTTVGRDQWAAFNVKQTIQDMVDGTRENYGFKFHANGNGQTYWKQLSAAENANKAKIVVNYHYPTMKNPTVTAAQYGDGQTTGYTNVSWPTVHGATSYELQMFNGKTFEKVYSGSGTSWTSKGKKIFPKTPYATTSTYKLDGTGVELAVDPSKFYSTKSGTATTRKDYGFKVKANYPSGSSPLSAEVKKTIPADQIDTPNMPTIKASAYPETDTVNKGKGWLDISWEAVPGATGYRVLIYNGKAHEEFSVGNVTSWSTKGQKVWPTDTEIAAGKYALHHDKLGTELANNPNPVYVNAVGNYTTFKRYAIRVKAESSLGVTPYSDSQYGYIPLAVPKNVKVTSTEIVDDVNNLGALNIQWDAVTDAGGYLVNFFDGVKYQQIDVGKVTKWSTKGISLFEGVESDLPADPTKEYKDVNTTNQTALDKKAYVFNVQAYRHSEANSPDTPEREKMEGYRGLGAKSANVYETIATDSSLLGMEPYFTFGTHTLGNAEASINVTTGNMNLNMTDHSLFTRGILGFDFTRSYNSKSDQVSVLGKGWTFTGNEAIEKKSGTSSNMYYWDEDGTRHEFVFNSITGSYSSPKGKYLTLKDSTVNSKAGFMLTDKEGFTKYFEAEPFVTSKYRLHAYKDSHSNIIQFRYTGNQLTEIAEVDAANTVIRNSIKLVYNTKGLLVRTSFVDRWIEYTYDEFNQLVGTIVKANGTTQTIKNAYDYDEGTGLMTVFTDGKGTANTMSYGFNSLALLTPQADGKESVETTYLYDKKLNQYQVLDTEGNITIYKRDTLNNTFAVSEVLKEGGVISKVTYDAQYNELSITDELGKTKVEKFDSNGNIISSISKIGEVTTLTYNDKNQVIETIDPNGLKTINYYNDNNLTSTQIGEETTLYEYDDLGREIKIIYPNNTFNSTSYDESSRKVIVTDTKGNTTSKMYDDYGQVISETDSEKRVKSYTYNLLHQEIITSVIDGKGNKTVYEYDDNGNLIALINSKGKKKIYKYNGNDQLLESIFPITDFLTLKQTKTYDVNGNLQKEIENSGTTKSYVYNELDQLSEVTVKNGEGQAMFQWTNSYDDSGQLLFRTYKNLATNTMLLQKKYLYTSDNLVANYIQGNYSYSNVYNDASQMTAQTISYDDTLESISIGQNIAYAEDGKIKSLSVNTETTSLFTLDYKYDSTLNSIFVNYQNGLIRSKNIYDDSNNLASIEYFKGAENSPSFTFAYSRDKSGNVIKQTDQNGTAQFLYDENNQLIKEELSNGITKEYSYDTLGNRLKTIQNGTETTYTYNNGNQVGTKNTIPFSYDLDGNLIQDDKLKYVYTPFGTISKVTTLAGTEVARYEYDEEGLRTKKVIGDYTHEYYYENSYGELTLEVIKKENQVQAYYYYQWDITGKVAGMVIKKKNSVGKWETKTYYFITNSQSDVMAILDQAGEKVGSYTYDAFGNVLSETGEIAKENPFRYASYYYDSETKNYYLKARYYNPLNGNFLTLDPYPGDINEPLTQNGYGYVSNNPIKYTDSTGRKQENIGSVGGGAIPWSVFVATKIKVKNGFTLLVGTEKYGWTHIVSRHINGKIPGKSLFPSNLSRTQVKNLVMDSVTKGKLVKKQADGMRVYEYSVNKYGIKKMTTVTTSDKIIWTSYPTKGSKVKKSK